MDKVEDEGEQKWVQEGEKSGREDVSKRGGKKRKDGGLKKAR